jgi:hypothetical protein
MTEESNSSTPTLGRNEPCHCGSGKKFKRCHGVDAAPKLSPPKAAWNPAEGAAGATPGAMPGGFDPSKMDPQMMQQFAQTLQRLPKGQLQRLQGIMQRAMAGKDVTQEAAEFERTLPPELQQLMMSFAGQMGGMPGGMGGMPGGMGMPGAALPGPGTEGGMSEEEARKIVEAAAAEGKISTEEAEKLLTEAKSPAGDKKGLGKLWRGITGKNP